MQDKVSFEDISETNGEKGITSEGVVTPLTPIADVIKSLGIEILKSEKETSLGKINLFSALFVFTIFLVQSFSTKFDVGTYGIMFIFCAFFVISVMLGNRSFRSKQLEALANNKTIDRKKI